MSSLQKLTPEVTLITAPEDPYRFAVAAARTCYSSRVMQKTDVTDEQKDRIGGSCFAGGHHSVFQHASFTFGLANVSRHAVWSFFHAHPFFNSSQSSQRYVKLNEPKVIVPPMPKEAEAQYEAQALRAWEKYREISALLLDDLVAIEKKLFPKKVMNENDEKVMKQIEKKAIELARYVIPLGCATSLYYTISGLTLWRLLRLQNQYPAQCEIAEILGEMKKLVEAIAPDYFHNLSDPIPLEQTLEAVVWRKKPVTAGKDVFAKEFDADMDGKQAKLIASTPNAEALMADAARAVMGFAKTSISDADMLENILNSAKNVYLTDTLNLATVSPLMRTMLHPTFTFKKKISHTADSQNQRHRTTPGSRPIMNFVDTTQPDYYTPELIAKNPRARELYNQYMTEVWKTKNELVAAGAPIEYAQYILPNAVYVRIIETGSLLGYWHKWRMRLCLNAQEEIRKVSEQEVLEVKNVAPTFIRFIGPDCHFNFRAKVKPFCPQGTRWCGYPIWVQAK